MYLAKFSRWLCLRDTESSITSQVRSSISSVCVLVKCDNGYKVAVYFCQLRSLVFFSAMCHVCWGGGGGEIESWL